MSTVEKPTEATKTEDVKVEEKKAEEKKTEEKKEEPKPKKDRKDMTLAEIIEDVVSLDEVNLLPRTKVLLKKLPKVDVKHLDNIESFFKIMMNDKKIDMKDVPVCMSLIQELFILYESLRARVSSADVGNVLRVLVDVLILYRLKDTKTWTAEEQESILKVLDTLIAMAVEMIDLKEKSKKINSLCRKLISLGACLCKLPKLPSFSTAPKKEEDKKEEDKKEEDKKEEDKKEEPKKEEPKKEEAKK